MCLLEDAGCISKSLCQWAAPTIIVPKRPDPYIPPQKNKTKMQLHLVLDNSLLNKSINAVHNGNNRILYLPLLNITDLLAQLWKCKLFFSLDQRSGYHHIPLIPEVKVKTAFVTTNGTWHWNIAQFGICSLPAIFCYLMSQVLSGLDFCFAYPDDIFICSTSWEEHLQHLQIIFKHLKPAKLKIKHRKCQFLK